MFLLLLFSDRAASRLPVLSCFFKSRENVPVRERPSGSAVGKAAKLHSTRSVLPRQGQAFHAMESSRQGTFLRSFRFYEKNQK